MEMIVGVFSFLLVIVCGQDVSFQYEQQCYSVKDSLTMTAVFSGSGTVTLVQWYYSNQTSSNLLITASSCDVFGTVPPGYPDASRMSYKCPTTHSLNTNTFELTLIGLKEDELEESWGATFSLSASASPVVNKSSITICETTTTGTTTIVTEGSSTTEEPCPCPWWCILLIVIGCLYLCGCGIGIGIFMFCCKDEPDIKRCVGDKIPCWVRILICILMIIIIVGLGILTVYGICKCCDCFGCCGGCCDDCCGSSNDDSTQNEMPMKTKK